MFEILFILTFFGVLYVDIIELLEKCEQLHTNTQHGVRMDYQAAS